MYDCLFIVNFWCLSYAKSRTKPLRSGEHLASTIPDLARVPPRLLQVYAGRQKYVVRVSGTGELLCRYCAKMYQRLPGGRLDIPHWVHLCKFVDDPFRRKDDCAYKTFAGRTIGVHKVLNES